MPKNLEDWTLYPHEAMTGIDDGMIASHDDPTTEEPAAELRRLTDELER
jgi:hypothetical protein